MVEYLFILTLVLYLLLVLLLVFLRKFRSRILIGFSLLCWLGLAGLGILTVLLPYADPQELALINYSSRRGHLYFLKARHCHTDILYDVGVNANEESSFMVEGARGPFAKVLFMTENEQLFTFPVDKDTYWDIAIWEKELEPADSCYWDIIKSYRRGQIQFAIATGLLIIGAMCMFGAKPGDKALDEIRK